LEGFVRFVRFVKFVKFVGFKKLNRKDGSKGYVKEMFKPLRWFNG
jgi:hypothetical protein